METSQFIIRVSYDDGNIWEFNFCLTGSEVNTETNTWIKLMYIGPCTIVIVKD